MKNIRAYLMTAAVSLILTVVSATSLMSVAAETAVCVPLLFGLVFSWSTVKAALTALEADISLRDMFPVHARDFKRQPRLV